MLTNIIPRNIIPNILNQEDLNPVIDVMINDEDFEKSGTEINF